jgi:PHD/YefM family antitoxin component YafN of YafNO toxin-antitoxin module
MAPPVRRADQPPARRSLPKIDEIPRRSATEVKNQWGDVIRDLRASGSVALTQHNNVEMVLVDASLYRSMEALDEAETERRRQVIANLDAEFEQRLAAMRDGHMRKRVEGVMAARGRSKKRPIVGESY